MSRYHILDPEASDPKRIKKEREKAQKLKKSQWWLTQRAIGVCHYCRERFAPDELTMDHVVPIARGGTSTPGNIVPACRACNRDKKLDTPVDQLLDVIAAQSAAGEASSQTRFFFDLTPDRVLAAVEASGFRCTGRCSALNSFENRVYDVELERAEDSPPAGGPNIADRRVVKFYRPGRWTREQILEEHRFLLDLQAAEVPVVAPAAFPDGASLHESEEGILYAVFPKVGGRAPDELRDEQLTRIGRLLARVHNVGAERAAPARVELNARTYGRQHLEMLEREGWLPLEYAARYRAAVETVCAVADDRLPAARKLRVHGDCHLGNLLWNEAGPFFLDFDDMVTGPAAQDVWLLVPGRDDESLRQREVLLAGYAEMREFDRTELGLVEVLRGLRFIHYTAWIARRWKDPAFPAAFPEFNSHRYWADETHDLEEQARICGS